MYDETASGPSEIEYTWLDKERTVDLTIRIEEQASFDIISEGTNQLFAGDTGSLALGGSFGAIALMLHKELLLPIICGIFFVETVSVIIQTTYFKYTKRRYGEGKRVFLMTPIHHHFEKKGLPESKIVVRFWIIAVLLGILSLLTLKLR